VSWKTLFFKKTEGRDCMKIIKKSLTVIDVIVASNQALWMLFNSIGFGLFRSLGTNKKKKVRERQFAIESTDEFK
jgi:hypothetical protein